LAAPRTHGTGRASSAADARVRAMLARHGATLLRVARQASLCEDDALDAVQRGLEIYLRRLETVEPATEAAWLKVVVRHEAYAIRHSRADCTVDPELQGEVPAADRSVEEQVLSSDRVSRSAEALRTLKPDEARALMLKAHGLSYEEIGRRCGWTYTKVNRCITEGRRRFMEAYAGLEDGTECERFAPGLAALAAGTATSQQLLDLRPHLRHCSACRATVRDLHRSRRNRLSLGLPPITAGLEWLRERLGGGRARPDLLPPRPEPQLPSPDAPLRLDAPLPEPTISYLERMHREATALLHRAHTSDVATSIQWMTSLGGGGRAATIGTILGFCLSGIGAGTVCVVTGVLDNPFAPDPTPARRVHRPAKQHSTPPTVSPPSLSAELATVRATATPAQRSVRAGRTGAYAASRRDPSQGRTPTSHRKAPISPAPEAVAADFAPAAASGTGAAPPPAPAPATGGSEFTP
jgi:RNA polymerase sigma factor (sigma-70 family)